MLAAEAAECERAYVGLLDTYSSEFCHANYRKSSLGLIVLNGPGDRVVRARGTVHAQLQTEEARESTVSYRWPFFSFVFFLCLPETRPPAKHLLSDKQQKPSALAEAATQYG